MTDVYCTLCYRRCYLYTLAAIPPKDEDHAVPGRTPEGYETNDIRQYCAEHYIKPEE